MQYSERSGWFRGYSSVVRFGERSGNSWTVLSLVSLQYDSNMLYSYPAPSSARHRDTCCHALRWGCVFQRCCFLLFTQSFPSLHKVYQDAQVEIMGVLVIWRLTVISCMTDCENAFTSLPPSNSLLCCIRQQSFLLSVQSDVGTQIPIGKFIFSLFEFHKGPPPIPSF